jgi:hypothetical protein
MTSRPARRSLAEAFQPAVALSSDRAESLSGLLPPRTVEDPQPLLPAAGQESGLAVVRDSPKGPGVGSSPPSGDATGSRRQSKRPPPALLELNLNLVRNVAVYLPLDLLDRFRRTARSRELTYADLVVEATAAHLDEVQGSFAPAEGSRKGVGMPARPPRRRPEPGVQVQIRLDGYQVAWLDEQAERLGAPSRSALVGALLQAHLGAAR